MSNPRSIEHVLKLARQRLRAAGIESAALDARLLLQDATGFAAEDIVLHPDGVLLPTAIGRFDAMIEQRLQHQPVSRILGVREFYGRSFKVSPAVLDPRPDTETVVELALDVMKGKTECRFLDVGTGSGAIAITLAAERPQWRGVAFDISEAALAVAQANADVLQAATRLEFVTGSWFPAGRDTFDLIISNPPYIITSAIAELSPDVKDYDPVLALDGGQDGLEAYRMIAQGAEGRLNPHGVVVVEIGAGQKIDVEAIFGGRGFSLVSSRRDLGSHIRGLAFAISR
ncbi:MAG: peptide chain release factor N(5)-glutamine methyltransferase [Aestuariivirga sp.]